MNRKQAVPRENQPPTPQAVGEEIGGAATQHGEQRAAEYCSAERRRLDLKNQPRVRALTARIAALRDVEQDILHRIALAPPAGDESTRRRKARFYRIVFAVLFAAGIALAVVTLQPYRLGWISWVLSGGVAIALAFLVDRALEGWANRRLLTVIASAACIPALAGLMLMADIRGARFAEESKATDAVVITGDTGTTQAQPNTFYESTSNSLRRATMLFAFVIELAAGLALHEAQRYAATGESRQSLAKELKGVRDEMIGCAHELSVAENEGAMFENQFWRDFHASVLKTAIRNTRDKLLLGLLVFVLIATMSQRMLAADCVNVVSILDLSHSEAVEDQARMSDFQRNVNGVSSVLANLPAGAEITVIGATADSFSQPYMLLQARLSSDEGYFKERLARGRQQLVSVWRKRSAKLLPNAGGTDLFGAVLTAAELFRQSPAGCRKDLIFFSDMRQSGSPIDFEKSAPSNIPELMSEVRNDGVLASLPQVQVQVLGANGIRRSVRDWQVLRDFWLAYFKSSGAVVENYSTLRAVPNL